MRSSTKFLLANEAQKIQKLEQSLEKGSTSRFIGLFFGWWSVSLWEFRKTRDGWKYLGLPVECLSDSEKLMTKYASVYYSVGIMRARTKMKINSTSKADFSSGYCWRKFCKFRFYLALNLFGIYFTLFTPRSWCWYVWLNTSLIYSRLYYYMSLTLYYYIYITIL